MATGIAEIPSMSPLQRGMTVLEVVVSLALAGLFLSSLLPSVVQSYARLKQADLKNRASLLAASKAEELFRAHPVVSRPIEGQVNDLMWRIDVGDDNSQPTSVAATGPSLRVYRISVFQTRNDPLVLLTVQRLAIQ